MKLMTIVPLIITLVAIPPSLFGQQSSQGEASRGVDNPPLTSPASSFSTPLIHMGSLWRYWDRGTSPGDDWMLFHYDDSSWSQGLGLFGYGNQSEDQDVHTRISYGPDPSNKHLTTYFRTTFVVGDPALFISLKFNLIRDDGIVIYLNGAEVYRANMPSGAVHYETLAQSEITGNDEFIPVSATTISSRLASGINVLAAEIHQAAPNSPDMSFYLQLDGQRGEAVPAQIVAESLFESRENVDGWSMAFNGVRRRDILSWNANGNGGGCLQIYDPGDDQSVFWNAPKKFLGNLQGAYGGAIEFDTRTSGFAGVRGAIVFLRSESQMIKIVSPYARRKTWLPFRIPLDEKAGWRKCDPNQLSSDLGDANREHLLAVLSNVTALWIAAEPPGVAGYSWLDNVRILAPPSDDPTSLIISSYNIDQILIQWPANRSRLFLEASEMFQGNYWYPITNCFLSNGMNNAIITRPRAFLFFRLYK